MFKDFIVNIKVNYLPLHALATPRWYIEANTYQMALDSLSCTFSV